LSNCAPCEWGRETDHDYFAILPEDDDALVVPVDERVTNGQVM